MLYWQWALARRGNPACYKDFEFPNVLTLSAFENSAEFESALTRQPE
jgi:hypothetical protein